MKEPYAILPTGKQEEWFVIVPKFIRMNIGWLDFSTNAYNVFRINKFANWLGEVPEDLQSKFRFKPKLPLTVFDHTILSGEQHQEETWKRYSPYLICRDGKDKLKIKKGYEFKLIAKLIDDGILPFMPRPIEEEDLLTPDVNFELRDYQKEAWKKFLECGAVGIFWAFSAGKTYFAMHAMASLKGRKLIVVPTRTLVEQWRNRVNEQINSTQEVDIITYHSFDKVKDKQYVLANFDECHHLPANMFSKLATIRAKYRIGLSGTPYREDGRTDYIFALTGFPVGLSWDNLIELGVIEQPDIRLYLVNSWQDKINKIKELIGVSKKTIIFCDSIKFGEKMSKLFEIPFISGKSSKRLEIIEEAETCIVSRVGDEGLSIPNLERVIEVDFLFGSRRQEGQRMGRLFHGKEKGEHLIIMTNNEYENYSKRLHAIIERGFKIEVIR